jgi:hypothetical protein
MTESSEEEKYGSSGKLQRQDASCIMIMQKIQRQISFFIRLCHNSMP